MNTLLEVEDDRKELHEQTEALQLNLQVRARKHVTQS